jgi:hypothetical protein
MEANINLKFCYDIVRSMEANTDSLSKVFWVSDIGRMIS